jgi:hypothetical protein
MISPYLESKKVDLTEVESRMVITRGWGEKGEMGKGWLMDTNIEVDKNNKLWCAMAP